jgi:hypothetical protein
MFLTLFACAEMQPMTPRNVSDEVSQINIELPRKVNDNTTFERVSHDRLKSALVCHYTVKTWDRAYDDARKESKHLFCGVMGQQYRDYLFSMADTIEFEYRTADGWVQYAFLADKNTCK